MTARDLQAIEERVQANYEAAYSEFYDQDIDRFVSRLPQEG